MAVKKALHVVAIMGSHRANGNGIKVVRSIEQRLKEHGDVAFDYVHLAEYGLALCRGCFVCIRHGEAKCPIRDGREALEKKLLAADGVIVYTPVYGMNVSALMKTFIDRFSYNGHHPRFFRQNALYVATTCGIGLKDALKSLRFLRAWGFHTVGEVGVKCPHYDLGEKTDRMQARAIQTAGDKLYDAMSRDGMPAPQFDQIKHFSIMRAMLRSLPDFFRAQFPADFNYWTENGWLNPGTTFFYDTPLKLHHRIAGWFIGKSMSLMSPLMMR